MTLNPRFTNRAVRSLFEESGIDVMHLEGDALTDSAKRIVMTRHACEGKPDEIIAACEDLTPGEHMDLLRAALLRDLVPASIREANAKAAPTTKSAEAAAE